MGAHGRNWSNAGSEFLKRRQLFNTTMKQNEILASMSTCNATAQVNRDPSRDKQFVGRCPSSRRDTQTSSRGETKHASSLFHMSQP